MDVHVLRLAVSRSAVDAVLRLLWREVWNVGLDRAQMVEWATTTWFPHLRAADEIVALQAQVATVLVSLGAIDPSAVQWCEPQILLRFPQDVEPGTFPPHVDAPPPWANGRTYAAIVGVALTDCSSTDGCLVVYRGGVPVPIEMCARDIVVLDPATPHAGSYNVGSTVRGIVYYRALNA